MKPSRMLALIRYDLANALRDSMILYILAAPALLAFALLFLLPRVETPILTVAIDRQMAAWRDSATELAAFAELLVLEDAEAVRARVAGNDQVAGIVLEDNAPVIILQGNEDGALEAQVRTILASLSRKGQSRYTIETIGAKQAGLREWSRAFLAMLATMIGGVAAAFALVDEKESKVNRSYAVSPLSTTEYFLARALWSFAVSAFGVLVAHLILGAGVVSAIRLSAALAASSFFPLAVCLLIGGLAANQIQAVAALKLVMFIFLTLPLASLFVPASWQPAFWILPNYWLFRTYAGVYTGLAGNFWLDAGICFGSGLLLCIVLAGMAARQSGVGRCGTAPRLRASRADEVAHVSNKKNSQRSC